MKYLCIVLLSMSLCGCAGATKIVKVPITIPCQIQVPPEPHYPIDDLRPGDGADVVAKSYVATVAGQREHINILNMLITSCNKTLT